MGSQDQDSKTTHFAPCIVAAWVWLAIVLYSLTVVPGLFNTELHLSKPEQMRNAIPPLERFFINFQLLHGTFLCALSGIIGCARAYMKKSEFIANAMILLGIAVMLGMVWATVLQVQK